MFISRESGGLVESSLMNYPETKKSFGDGVSRILSGNTPETK
jgi:hypothetical protein